MRQTVCDRCGSVIEIDKGYQCIFIGTEGKKRKQVYYHFDLCKPCKEKILVEFQTKPLITDSIYKSSDC